MHSATKKLPDDALIASNMNVYPGWKQPVMRDGLWNGSAQHLPDGIPKGMKKVLQELGVDVKGMNAEKMREASQTVCYNDSIEVEAAVKVYRSYSSSIS